MIKSISYNQSRILRDILNLCRIPCIDLDVTYRNGGLYKTDHGAELFDADKKAVIRPRFRFDLRATSPELSVRADCRQLPVRDASLKCVVFDPPFLANSGAQTGIHIKRGMIMQKQNVGQVNALFKSGIREIFRVLKKGGIAIVKCQDYVNDHRQHWAHCNVYGFALEAGFVVEDLFILLAYTRPIRENIKRQIHARKFHCYFWVFRKPQRIRKKKIATENTENTEN